MRKFIKKILLFIAPIILISYPIDFLLSNALKNTSSFAGEYEVWNDIFDKKINADIAIYGSSRAWVHFNPKLFEKYLNKNTYNFGIDGHNFWLQYLRHIEYFKYNPHPKQIIFSVDVFTLAKRKDLYNFQQFLPYMLWNKDIINYTSSYEGFSKIDYYLPLVRYISNIDISLIKSLFLKNEKYRYKGFKGMTRKWNGDLSKAKEKNPEYKVDIDNKSLMLFRKFINDLKKENISLIFVYSPEYIEGQSFVKNRNRIINIYKNIAKEYDIPFFDYSDDPISYKKELFYNTLHLNKKGANEFTKKFIEDLKKYERTTKNIMHLADSAQNKDDSNK